MATAERVDFGALEAKLSASITDLNSRRGELALDALSDPRAKAELQRVEAALAKAEGDLDRLKLAGAEAERREIAARAAALAEQQRAALDTARDLQEQRRKAAQAFDRAAAKLITALMEWADVAGAQQRALAEAGQSEASLIARPSPYLIEGAIGLAIHEAGASARHLALSPLRYVPADQWGRLAEADVVAIAHVVPIEAEAT